MLAEYRERLREARAQADGSSRVHARARRWPSASCSTREARAARSCSSRPRRDIEAETRRAIAEIRDEVANLTILATEKLTRKTLDEADQQPAGRGGARRARLLGAFDVRRADGGDRRRLRALAVRSGERTWQPRRGPRAARGARGRARRQPRHAGLLLLTLLLECREGGGDGARGDRRQPVALELHRAADREPPHAGAVPHPPPVRRAVRRAGPTGCPSPSPARSSSTSARSRRSGSGSASAPAATSSSRSAVDPEILGGIVLRVGNSILDASIRGRLEQLRTQVARG